jgi:hypothetical protein
LTILKLPGIADLLGINLEANTTNSSTLASQIINSAYTHQWKASDTRLGLPNPTTKGALNKGLTKAKETMKEWAGRKQENMLKSVGVKISATIWESSSINHTKPKQVELQ